MLKLCKKRKEMYKKVRCTCKVVVLLIKPFVFLTFSLPSMSLDLKVPNSFMKTHAYTAKKTSLMRENKTD